MELSKVRLVDVYPQRGSAVALIDYDLVGKGSLYARRAGRRGGGAGLRYAH